MSQEHFVRDGVDAGNTLYSRLTGRSRTFMPGEIIDSTYRLLEPIGRGGMGVVFACYHVVLNRSYAIKILSGDNLQKEHWDRFRLEAQTLARLNHPGIVSIHNMGIEGGQWPYFVMELLDCDTLSDLIKRRGKLSCQSALPLFVQVADALAQAHQQGIVHRDIKPANIMLSKDRASGAAQVKIVDFGIARVNQDRAHQSQTATGTVFGTPYYMSPEQCSGERVDHRSDIYSFGCALYEALCGRPPYVGANAFETFMLHQSAPLPPMPVSDGEVDLPLTLEILLARLLAKRPEQRYQSMDDVKRDLRRIIKGKSIGGGTIKPVRAGEPLYTLPDRQPVDSANYSALVPVLAVLIGLAALFLYSYPAPMTRQPAPPVSLSSQLGEVNPIDALKVTLYRESIGQKSFIRYGGSATQLKLTLALDYEKILKEQEDFKAQLERYVASQVALHQRFKRGESFCFPDDLIVGNLRVGDKLIPACGKVTVPPGSAVTLCLSYRVDGVKDLYKMIGPDDFSGLEIAGENSEEILYQFCKWQNPRELCLFSPYIKMAPGQDAFDECAISDLDLVRIDGIRSLKSLGLAGEQLSFDAITRMTILPQLETLKIKRVDKKHLHLLLQKLQQMPKLKELWLVSEDLNDESLRFLTDLKSLSSLHIVRSQLTVKSIKFFRQMKNLRHLYIDDNFSAADKARFKSLACSVQYEPLLDYSHWKLHPGDHVPGSQKSDFKADLLDLSGSTMNSPHKLQ